MTRSPIPATNSSSSAPADEAATRGHPAGLAHELVRAEGSSPDAWVMILHGILGMGQNFRSFARKLVQRAPTFGLCLVDLPQHGGSRRLPPPHTLDAAVDALGELHARLPGPLHALVGHSFGGKVALSFLAADVAPELREVVVLDSNPGPREGGRGSESTLAVLRKLRALPPTFESRADFVARLRASGETDSIAQWLAMNLVREGDVLRFGLDLDAIDALLDDYFARDSWATFEHPPREVGITAVVGGRSEVFQEADRTRLARAAAANPRVHLHVIPAAGHWVHVEAQDETLDQVAEALARASRRTMVGA